MSNILEIQKLGDLFVVKCGTSSGGPASRYQHAGVCCSEEEKTIIQLTLSPFRPSSSRHPKSSSGPDWQASTHRCS
ncbi:hypothetical protein AMELA_G00083100 [Ameiurus melas]|uniref:Uncharacterized protein n=1 Tax=Ameiurus melas TaxID=219545 RepID=A0A7J6B088_AMEME|nr:hypothetical protein AMELA_G00083100 [Ameiurus melas]